MLNTPTQAIKHRWVFDSIESLGKAQSLPELKKTITKVLAEIGFPEWLVGIKSPTSMVTAPLLVLTNFPFLWLTEYAAKGFFKDDPLLVHAQTQSLPLVWDTENGWENHPPNTKKFMAAVLRRGWKSGLVTPIHSADGTRGTFNIPSREPLSSVRARFEELQEYTPFIGLHIYESVKRIGTHVSKKAVPQLTPRELECLTWASEGKTAWEIGTILCISERTATHHLQEAINKMGSKNRQQAIAQAIALSIVQPRIDADEIISASFGDDSNHP